MFTLLGREGGRFNSRTAMFYAAIGTWTTRAPLRGWLVPLRELALAPVLALSRSLAQ